MRLDSHNLMENQLVGQRGLLTDRLASQNDGSTRFYLLSRHPWRSDNQVPDTILIDV